MRRHLILAGALLASLLLLAGPLMAADPGVSLLRPDSLAGWTYGSAGAGVDSQPMGWEIKDGKLSGNARSAPLLSGWTFADFDLRLKWSAKPKSGWSIVLPQSPGGEADSSLQITLGADSCGRVEQGAKQLAAGVETKAAESHDATISRRGDLLTVTVDGNEVSRVTLENPKRRFGLGLSAFGEDASLWDLRLNEPKREPIFNGRNLAGWWTPGSLSSWVIEDGDLVCINKNGNYLRTEKEYGNFTLSFAYKIVKGGNSGVGIRTAREGWPSGDGMELQILDKPGMVRDSTMAIYGNCEPIARADKSEQWNDAVIKADGRMISAWVNGALVQQVNTARLPEIQHRHLKGWIGLQDHGGRISFRDLRVLEAPDGPGMNAWYRAETETAPKVLLDRLMNSRRLATADGYSSGVAAGSTKADQEQVVADLKGPGAMVGAWFSKSDGMASVYIDDAETPLIRCKLAQLYDHVPPVAEDRLPLVTCVAYAKSLKIVLSGPALDYRFDFTSFPAAAALQSYAGGNSSLPRAMLPALHYRHHQLSHGTHREQDPYRRVSGQAKTLEPGSSVQLASVDGRGVVLWLKLQADPKLLANDDLWLDITLGGETRPAISAPARFLFPALRKGNHHSFVMTQRNGATEFLAMPYGQGIAVAARNAGKKPLGPVGVTLSVNDSPPESPNPLRLRGVYQPAGSGDTLIDQRGAGRWIGFVYADAHEGAAGVSELVVDSQPQPGWTMTSLDPLFGRPGKEAEFFHVLSGRSDKLSWRYLLLAPVEFKQSLSLKPSADTKACGARLALFYMH